MSGIERIFLTARLRAFVPALAATLTFAGAPALAQDAPGLDFLKMQQEVVDGDAAMSETPESPIAESDAQTVPAPVLTLPMEAAAPQTLPATAEESALRPGVAGQSYLEEIAALQREIARLKLEAAKIALEAEIADARANSASATPAASAIAPQQPVEAAPPPPPPSDDPAELPSVISVIGTGGILKVELKTASGGRLTAVVGDTLPGGYRITKIDQRAVMAASLKTGIEYRLASDSSGIATASAIPDMVDSKAAPTAAESGVAATEETAEEGAVYIIPDPQ